MSTERLFIICMLVLFLILYGCCFVTPPPLFHRAENGFRVIDARGKHVCTIRRVSPTRIVVWHTQARPQQEDIRYSCSASGVVSYIRERYRFVPKKPLLQFLKYGKTNTTSAIN